MKIKIFFGFIALVPVTILGLMLYDMKTMNIEVLILCSSNQGGIRIPSKLCNYYMVNFRIDEDDIKELSEGAGLEFILNGQNPIKYQIAETFISRGLDVNGVNNYSSRDLTPLHAAVLYNDAEVIRFLISQGANVHRRSKGYYGMTPLELAEKLHEEEGLHNRSKIITILSDAN